MRRLRRQQVAGQIRIGWAEFEIDLTTLRYPGPKDETPVPAVRGAPFQAHLLHLGGCGRVWAEGGAWVRRGLFAYGVFHRGGSVC